MISRRDFLQGMAALTAGAVLPAGARSDGATPPAAANTLPMRTLGRTDEEVTMFGVGGWHIGAAPEAEAERMIATAIERGVNFFDTAESYQNGESERRFGKYLTPKHRDRVYLMTKTRAHDARTARRHLDESRTRLKADVIDLWQIHAIDSVADVDGRIGAGVLDVLLEARDQGRVRHLGFTGHTTTAAHLHLLDELAQRGIDLDTCQMPVNILDPSYESFITQVMPKLVERDYAVLAMKTLAWGQILGKSTSWKRGNSDAELPRLVPDRVSLATALHFVWSLPVAVLISGTDDTAQLEENLQIARDFEPLSEADRLAIIDKVADAAGPTMEFYKA